jgi:hypothetical protein
VDVVNVVGRANDDDALQRCEPESKKELRPTPESDTLLVPNASRDNEELRGDNTYSPHG